MKRWAGVVAFAALGLMGYFWFWGSAAAPSAEASRTGLPPPRGLAPDFGRSADLPPAPVPGPAAGKLNLSADERDRMLRELQAALPAPAPLPMDEVARVLRQSGASEQEIRESKTSLAQAPGGRMAGRGRMQELWTERIEDFRDRRAEIEASSASAQDKQLQLQALLNALPPADRRRMDAQDRGHRPSP